MALLPPPRHPLPKESDHSNISTFFTMLSSDDKGQQYDGLTGIRKLLSMEHNPPIQEIIDTGHVPKILEFLNWDHDPKFQLESAWAVTNICSGTSQHVAYMVQIGSLEHIGKLLLSNSAEVVDQAVWAVGNIAGDSTYYRDLCLNQGFMQQFLTTLVRFPSNTSIIRNTVWGMSNLIRGKPMPPYEKVGAALPYLAQAIATFHYDIDIVTDALWGISYLSELDAQMIINVGLIPGLVVYLGHNTPTLITPALRALGNIVTGNDNQTSIVLDSPGFLSRIFALTVHAKKSIRKEAFWTISNIAAGNSKQIQTILQVPEYMKILKEGLDAPADIATEAAWCWTNFLAGATREQVVKLFKEYQCIECLDIILSNPKSKVRAQAVDAAARTLSKLQETQEFDECLKRFKDQGLYDRIISLPKKGEVSTHIAEFESYFDKSGSTKTFEKVDKEGNEGSSKKKINEKVAESESDSDEEEEEEEENHGDGDDDEEDEDEEDENEDEKEGEDGEDDENNPYLNPARED